MTCGRPLAPLHQLARQGPGGGAEAADPRQAGKDRLHVALVAGALQRLALLARPAEPSERRQPALQLGGQLEQVNHVLAGIRQLLGGQGTGVPAREARRLGDPQSEQLHQ